MALFAYLLLFVIFGILVGLVLMLVLLVIKHAIIWKGGQGHWEFADWGTPWPV
ncbi:hypothetical protein [Pseudomonas cichorii]|uniref:Uncharacterized protein n=1 Tax=Pseudomonas cichorii TaxID=36746 RepID=A0A3M4VDB0_PSECI|nr:hypothetical protein [Pseudomonas cichorii]AHF67025.1 hypothetical protein PCH70_18720 [Pseudomonas cichorii JBC1]QVE18908.1 hypothetical protein KGD89_09365 [Pseudomonas cichorii]RMR49603.1 hypothetical protein ALP84_01947 [Pseudomonas cichorii]SDN62692.1 hypothetical protein SAMN05216599_102558 [Pseudomonas cichorii]